MRPSPDELVIKWFDKQNELDLWVSSVTLAEIYLGIESLPDGRRKSNLRQAADQMFSEDFNDRCLPFDEDAARQYARIVSESKRCGSPVSVEDAQIAAIAITGGMVLATRNHKDFKRIHGIKLINPWD